MRVSANQYGLFLSLIIHFIIFAIPFSVLMKKDREAVEFFVFIEEAYKEQEILRVNKKVTKEAIIKNEVVDKVNKIAEPVENVEKNDQKIIENIFDKPLVSEKLNEETKNNIVEDVKAKMETAGEIENKHTLIDTEFGSAIAPSFLHKEIPEYPMIAKKLGKEGKVVLRLTIDEKGQLVNIEVIERAGYGFTESAIEAVKKSTFLPAKKNGVPVMSRAMLPIKFILRRNN